MSSEWKLSWNQRKAKYNRHQMQSQNQAETPSSHNYQHTYPKEHSSSPDGTEQKNPSLLNMLRMQSLNDTDETPKPNKLNSKMTAFDEGMQRQGIVIPSEKQPVVKRKLSSQVSRQQSR